MDLRTSQSNVLAVIQTALNPTQINRFMLDANLWVTEELGAVGLSDARLELIERYLTCALIRVRDLGLKSSTIGDVSEQYQVDADVTDYLLRAASFDPSGTVRSTFLNDTMGAAGSKQMVFVVGAGFRDDV